MHEATGAQTAPANVPISGYLSEAHKRKFTITAGILGAVFFIVQFLVPYVIFMAVMPSSMFSLKQAWPERGTYWDNAIWYLEKSDGPARRTDGPTKLRKIVLNDKKKPKTVCPCNIHEAWLLASDSRLWIIGSSGVDYYQDGKLNTVSAHTKLGDISRPFLYDGRPAVVEERPEGLSLMVLTENMWQKERSIDLETQKTPSDIKRNLQVLSDDGKLHFFLRYGGTLYYTVEQADATEQNRRLWQTILQVGNMRLSYSDRIWQSLLMEGKPTVFYASSRNSHREIIGARLSDGRWDTFFSHDVPTIEEMGVYPLEKSDKFAVLVRSFFGIARLLVAEGTQVVAENRYGGDFFSSGFPWVMFVPNLVTSCMPLVLALILSVLMQKHRQCVYESERHAIPFASLARRAAAQIIDSLCLFGVIIVGYLLLIFMPLFNVSRTFLSLPHFAFTGFVIIIGGLLWAFLCLLLFSYLEGKRGVTPGKWALGIRVLGTDLQPCGFGRALIRNLLKFVDGFLNFMVGILLVALTENWQRVGDLAARTVVVRLRNKDNDLSFTLPS